MEKIAMIIVAHEDDMEILGFHTVYNLIEAGFGIIEVVMTDGRFGLECNKKLVPKNPEFRGERLRRIRKHEVINASKAFGMDKDGKPYVNVILLNYVDGYLPFNLLSVNRLKELILKYKPIVSIGMDPFFPLDQHHDHINAGRNYFFALKSIPAGLRPKKMFFIQNFKNNVYIPLGDTKMQQNILSLYKSQLKPIMIKLMSKIMKFFYPIKTYNNKIQRFAGLREVSFDYNNNKLKSIKDKILWLISYNFMKTTKNHYVNLYKPVPKIGEIESITDPRDIDNINEKNLSKFYFGRKYK